MEVTNQESFKSELLTGSSAIEYFNAADKSQVSIFVIGFAAGEPAVSFEFLPSSLKKGGEFTVSIKTDGSGLLARARGDFELKLRSGVVPVLGDSPIVKVEGIAYMGGRYRGFMSRLTGQTWENTKDWIAIKDYKIK